MADSALYSATNLQKLAATQIQWMTRVPATWREAQDAWSQVDLQKMVPLVEGYRYPELASTYGNGDQRWLLSYSEPRQAPAQRPIAQQGRQPSDHAGKAWKKVCGPPFACEADARPARGRLAQTLQATSLSTSTVQAQPRYGKRGRPGPATHPPHMVYYIDGALGSSLTAHQARIDQPSCFLLATNELDTLYVPPHEVLAGYKGQVHAERGFHFLKAPQFFASSLYRKKPERIMALLMVMTVC